MVRNASQGSAGNDETVHALARRGFLQSLLAAIGALLVVGLGWIVSRDAPSAGRDPEFTPPALAPTRPAATATPEAVAG